MHMGCQDPGQGGGKPHDPHLGGAIQAYAGIPPGGGLCSKSSSFCPPCRPIVGPKTLAGSGSETSAQTATPSVIGDSPWSNSTAASDRKYFATGSH